MRGGDENSATASALGAGMAEIDALFRPAKHKQTEHIQESRRRRVDIHNGTDSDVDLEGGVAVIRRRDRDATGEITETTETTETTEIVTVPGPAHDVGSPPVPAARRAMTISPASLTVAAAATESER
jgi:hypothetical protein